MKQIVFTDHAPFPDNPFGSNRMSMEELPEYLSSIYELKDIYSDKISVHIGLEIEYLPTYRKYYEELLNMDALEFLMLGQHSYEINKGIFGFQLPREKRLRDEIEGISKSTIEAVETGLFPVIAHPEYMFCHRTEWDEEMTFYTNEVINIAKKNNVILEKNRKSKKRNIHYNAFWDYAEGKTKTIYGYDAHCVSDIDEKFLKWE